jgi:hypothetical protein
MKINIFLFLIFFNFTYIFFSQETYADYKIIDAPYCVNNKGEEVKFQNMKSKTSKITLGIAKKDGEGKPIIYRFNYNQSSKPLQMFIDYHECAHHQTGDLDKPHPPQNNFEHLMKESIADCIAAIRMKSDNINGRVYIKKALLELNKAMKYIGFDKSTIKSREDNILNCFNKNISLSSYIENIIKKNIDTKY